MSKKSFLLILVLLLILPTQAFAGPTTPVVESSQSDQLFSSGVHIIAPSTVNLRPGESQSINISITDKSSNVIDTDKINILGVTATTDKPNEVFILDKGYQPGGENSNTTNYSFSVQASDLASNTTASITFKVDYYKGAGKESEVASATAVTNVRVLAAAPTVTVSRTDILPTNQINPGDPFTVGFEFTNTGNAPVKDLVVSLDGLTEAKVEMASGISSQTILNLPAGGREYISFDLRAAADIQPGTHLVNMTWMQGGVKESGGKGSFSFFVTRGANQNSSMVIKNLVVPTKTLYRNQSFNVSFDIVNEGTQDARNIIVKATPAEESNVVSKSVSQVIVPMLKPKESKSFSYDFMVASSADTRNYPIKISVEYEDDSTTAEKKKVTEQIVGAFVNAPKETDKDAPKSTPKLIIDKYSFDPQLVPAGSTFNMTLSFFNTNSDKTVKNIKIFLTSKDTTDPKTSGSTTAGGSVFTPVDSSNTFYIDSIPPKGHVEKTISMFTVPEAVAKTYELTANFEYEDSANNPYTATEIIGIPVIQTSKLEIGEITVPQETNVGNPTEISVDFYNTGKVTLQNTLIKASGDFTGENLTYYLGNFESGNSDSFRATITPNNEGKMVGKITFSYEDSSGKKQTEEREFTINVTPAPEISPEDLQAMQGGSGVGGILKSPITWVGLAAVAGIATVVIRKIKKRKSQEGLKLDE
ncbi:MAG: hypothetical protein GXZ11_08040 [Tissierellia bacterium]|nr:hypothetical protein [Tissierellia bacterium]